MYDHSAKMCLQTAYDVNCRNPHERMFKVSACAKQLVISEKRCDVMRKTSLYGTADS